MKPKIIIIQGPTASGKSAIAIKLAKEFNGFLISADSRMIYKGMDIGTNKDKGKWLANTYIVQGVEEKMIDVVQPDQEFTVDDWVTQVKKIIKEDKRLTIIVGGTGFYTQALTNNFKLPVGKNIELRAEIVQELAEKGIAFIVKKIKVIDPEIESKIDIQNPRRVIRAAEVCFQTKKPLERKVGKPLFDALQIGINFDREKLYEKINKRVDEMIKEGLVQEVEGLMKKGYSESLTAMTGIGYRQIVQYLTGKISSIDAVELIKRDTRRYAKRQITWLKRDKSINWVDTYKEAQNLLKKFV
ncbi:MAG: tRNA dimethylallyltransferase [Parcubacteria group bacterium GW2011_GWC2_38_7]|nr:MAG: tRNA dimethylallyltransferase [Parcubacteria group bacterium GW2011_GWC2_38_7]